jgi:hypothetical protein
VVRWIVQKLARVDPTEARYGQVLNEKQPTANQCDGLFFFHRHFVFVQIARVDGWAARRFRGWDGVDTI